MTSSLHASPFRSRLALRLLACASPLVAVAGCERVVSVTSGGSGGSGGSGPSVGVGYPSGPSGGPGGGPSGPTVSPTTSVSHSSASVTATTYTTYSGPYTGQNCIQWPSPPPTGATTGATTTGSTTAANGSSSTGAYTNASSSSGGVPPCPSQQAAYNYFPHFSCGVAAVLSDGTYEAPGICCYEVSLEPCSGRPFLVGDEAVTAPFVMGEGRWSDAPLSSFVPNTTELSSAARRIAAEAWAKDAALEHASIASFGRFALELLAVAAPADLIEEAHRAAIDEVRHARLCFELASAYGGESVAPSAFPFGGAVEVDSDLASIAARVVREGCVGETLAAVFAAEQLAHATDPTVRRVLAAIAEDESRHAELAWRAVAWAIEKGGARVRQAVATAFTASLAPSASSRDAIDDHADELGAHGRLPQRVLSAAAESARGEIIVPAMRALLGGNDHAAIGAIRTRRLAAASFD